MAVFNYMELSTAHITEGAAGFLNSIYLTEKSGLIVYKKDEYGWFVWVPDDMSDGYYNKKLIPESLWRCIKYASENNCGYLMLDASAEIIEDLPEYEW